MRFPGSVLAGRAKRRLIDDLATDPFLRYILLLSALLTAFWFWDLIPNFATKDEEDRLFDAMTVIGSQVDDPGLDSLQNAVTQGHIYGAVLYLNLIALIPAMVYAALTGQLDSFVPFYRPDGNGMLWSTTVDLYYYWQGTPEWVWTSSLVLIRLINILLAVGCVYLVYRIGTTMRDRTAGRLSALLMTLTFGFVVMAHEGGEEIPLVFCLLVVIYLSLRYIETGESRYFFAGCLIGGFAIGFKLTGALAIGVLALAYLLRAYTTGDWSEALVRPRLLVIGMALGALAVIVGFPSMLLTGPEALIDRIARGGNIQGTVLGGRRAPIWWWFLRSYLNGFGLVLFVAGIGGIAVGIWKLKDRDRSMEIAGTVILLGVIGALVLFLMRWNYVRVHHLFPSFPPIVLLGSLAAIRLRDRSPQVGGTLIALVVVSSAIYAGIGTLGYMNQPRDQAASWLSTNAGDATVETYELDMMETAVPYGMNSSHYAHGKRVDEIDSDYIPPHSNWMTAMPERCPEYVVLSYNDLLVLAPPDLSVKAAKNARREKQKRHINGLLDSEYPYTVVGEFGPRPAFIGGSKPVLDSLPELLRVGIIPRTMQYGDEQDLGPEQYTMILKRTGQCEIPNNESESQ